MTDNPKKYLVQVDSYDPKIIDADAFEKKRDDFFQKFPQANVTEISSFEDDDEVGDSDSLLIQIDSYDPKIIDADTYRRKSADFRKAYPDAKISRVKPVDYWGDRLRETDSAIAPLEKRLGEIDEELSSPDIRVGGFRRADAVRLANEKSNIGKQLEGLYADRDNNYLYRKQREAQAKMFEDEDTKLSEMQKQLSDENPDAEKARRASLVGGGAGPHAASAQVFYRKDSDPEFNRDAESLALARIYIDEAKKTAFAPSKGDKSNGFANFFRGLQGAAPESISVVNLIKTGLDMHLVDAIKKIQETDGEDANIFDLVESPDKLTYLSSSEKELVKAFCIKSAVDAERAGDLSIGYQAGDSAMRSLGFMADFLMFGGEGSLANAAGKKATEGLLKATARASNRLALKGMARKAALAPAKFGIGTLEAAVKTAVMTPMMPSSWTNLTDNLLSVNDAGQVDLSGKAILNAMGDTFIENLSENAGEQVEAIIDAPFKLAGKAMSKVIPETKFTDWAKIFRNSGASRLMRDAAWHGYFGEIGEEWYGNALRVMTGVDKDALKNFATVDQQLITLISFAPMSVFGMGTSAGQYLSARKGMNKSAERLSALLSQNGYDEAQIRDILDVTKAENPTQLAAKLSPVITQLAEDNATEDSGAQIYRAVCDYAQAVARYRVFDGIHDADVSDQRNAMANELSDRAGLTSIAQTHDAGNGVTYETVRTLTDPDAGPAYVVGEQDGKLALVQADNGRKYFIPKEQIGENVIDSGEMPLNDFLDREIARKRSASEAERIETDRKQQAQEIFGALNIGDSINVGTEEDPAMGMVIAKQLDGRTVIQLPDGSVNEYTPSEIGNLIGKPISSKTDEQIETEAADAEQEVDDAVRWFRDARYSGEAQGLPFVMADGSTVVINDVRRGESTGSVTATITTSDGQETTTELPARSVNEAILGSSAVTDEAETKDDSTPRDFRGNPLPLKEDGNIDQTALWNNDPEAWAMWNDSVRNDGGENSLAYIETAAGKLKKDIKNIDKEYAKTTDFDKRDSLEGTRKNLQERLAALDAVRARYAERQNAEAAAKMQAGIERAREARKAKADELAKYNTESLEGINKKWEDAPKDIGTDDVIVLPNGEEIGGNYVLTEAFAPTPSHDTEKGYAKTEGFPVDENGQTVNDRDYEHDKEAQRQVEQKAAAYDQRALQTPVVVSSDGVVLSGNDRTMASQLAARQGTDTKYNEYLAKHPQKYGFTAEQVAKYSNPRVVFVPTESMPYTASTFAKFNAEEKKTQSKTESAVKAGKTITPETVATIAQIIDAHESIAETYADEKAVAAIIRALVDAGTVQENEISRLMDGNLLSGTGEDLVESVLLGAVMREDALRCAMGDKAIRRSIMSALTQLLKNNTYGEYSLSGEFSDAVVLLYQAKHSGLVKGGESIANYMNQPVLEGFGENPLAAATVQMIANTINGTKVNGLKNVLSLYNAKAEMAASGQADLFLGDVETKEQIIREILNEYGYNTETFAGEQQQSTAAAAEQPEQGSSEEQAPDAVSGDAGSGAAEEEVKPIGNGPFGAIYDKFRGKAKEAIEFLRRIKSGEAVGALHHKDIGEISIVWGNSDAGLEKILRKHPEVVDNLQSLIDNMSVMIESENRIILENDTHKAVISKMLGQEETPQWLLTAYEKKKATGGSSDIVPESQRDKQNGTAPLQSTSSDGKSTQSSETKQENAEISEGRSIQGLEGYSRKQIKGIVSDHIRETLSDAGINAEIVGVEIHGSRNRGNAREDSDLDIVVEYRGDIREDDMFNTLNDAENQLVIEGIKVDINPIRAEETGTLQDYMKRSKEYDQNKAEEDFREYTKTRAKEMGFDERIDEVVSPEEDYTGEIHGWGKNQNIQAVRAKDGRVFYRVFVRERKDGHFAKEELLEEAGYYDNPSYRTSDMPKNIEFDTYDEAEAFDRQVAAGKFQRKNVDKKTDEETNLFAEAQRIDNERQAEKSKKGNESVKSKTKKETPEKIEDYGEQIAGARKDMLRDLAKSVQNASLESLISLPFGKAFKKPNLRKAVETGALRESDAQFAQSIIAAFLSTKKPVAGTKDERRKQRWGQKTDVQKWAEKAYTGVKILQELFNADEETRDRVMQAALAEKYVGIEEAKAEQKRISELNSGREFNGTSYPLNLIALYNEVFNRLGYPVGQETKIPVGKVAYSSTFDSYSLRGANGKDWLMASRDLKTFEDVVDEMVYLIKVANADETADHPVNRFKRKGINVKTRVSGYRVLAAKKISLLQANRFAVDEIFPTEEEALKRIEELKSQGMQCLTPIAQKERIGYEKYEIVFENPLTNEYIPLGKEYETAEEADAAPDAEHDELNRLANEAIAAESKKHGDTAEKSYFHIISYYEKGEDGKYHWYYGIALDDKYGPKKTAFNTMPFFLAEHLNSHAEAQKMIDENKTKWEGLVKNIVRQRSDFVYFSGENASRQGEDYRKGKDVTAEEFAKQFGFRGVQFGNWANQADRQAALNNAYDSFMDMAKIIGVSPRAMSLDGELGIAFGSRGSGAANAHYEPGEVVINLTKTRGAGALAHEWWHALDNYFSRSANVKMGYVTSDKRLPMREEMREAFNKLVDDVEKSDYHSRSTDRGASYWGTREEETARLFEVWIADEMIKRGERNAFLAGRNDAEDSYAQMGYAFYKAVRLMTPGEKVMSFDEFKKTPMALKGFVYPTREELETLGKDVRDIFGVVEERTNEETGDTALFQMIDKALSNDTPEKQLAFDTVSQMLSDAGIPVEHLSDDAMRQMAEASQDKGEAELLAHSNSPKARWLNNYVEAVHLVTGEDKKSIRKKITERIAEARREAKELYANVLSGNFNSLTLRQINNYIDNATNKNRFLRPLSQRLPERALAAVSEGGRTSAVDALFSRICESTVPANGRTRAEARRAIETRKEELLEGWAKATGNWHESIADFTGNTAPIKSGTDSDVYLSDDGGSVIKASKGKFDNRKFPSDIDQVNLFNAVFPHSAYRILGYGRLNGKFVRFIEQQFVDFSTSQPLTTEERVEYMRRLGFEPRNEEKTVFSNGEIVVSDLQKSNIVKDTEGNIRVIDADVKLHTKDIGGNYTYPPVETDTEVPEFMTVYHGSGAKFDKFDHSHMGEGEGVQAYGWGTYVTEVEGIGKSYAKKISQSKLNFKHALSARFITSLKRYMGKGLSFQKAKQNLIEVVSNALKDQLTSKDSYYSQFQHDFQVLKDMTEEDMPKEILYTVDIPEDNGSNYLHLEESDAAEAREFFEHLLTSNGWRRSEVSDGEGGRTIRLSKEALTLNLDGGEDGYMLYDKLADAAGGYKQASLYLSYLGVIGNSYPAQYMSGGRSDGTRNYVIFDENNAKITERIELLKDGDVVYGAAVGGKIFLNADRLNPDTPIHEYTHLWDKACKARNPELWKRGVELMKQTSLWKEVENDPNYAGLDEDGIAGEVHARLSGEHGAETLERLSKEAIDENGNLAEAAMKASVIGRLRKWLSEFWHWVKDTMTPWSREEAEKVSIEDFINMPLADLAKGTKLNDNQYNAEERNIIDNAKKDGTFMKAPNGNPTNLNERQWVQVRTEAFKEWFGDWENDPENSSKVVDENGEPKVVFHGTDAEFSVFDPEKADGEHKCMYFSDSRKMSGSYKGDKLFEVFLNIRDSYEFNGNGKNWNNLRIFGYTPYEGDDLLKLAKAAYEHLRGEANAEEAKEKLGRNLYGQENREYFEKSTLVRLYKEYESINAIKPKNWLENIIKRIRLSFAYRRMEEYKNAFASWAKTDKHPSSVSIFETREIDRIFNDKDGIILHSITDYGSDVKTSTPADVFIVYDANNIKSATANSGEFSIDNNDIRFSIVTDKEDIERLNAEPTIKVYRAMQLVNGKLYPPMSGKVNGKWRDGIAVEDLGKVWEKADENPELADDKGRFTLNKGNGTTLKARYNPYIHTSTTPLNDQFSSAQSRPELVTVEVEIPKSELTSGYKADKAKDSVGKVEWKAGVVQGKLSGTRTVILSRWDKPVRIVPESEVADKIVEMFDGKDITIPSNVVTPALRAELEKRGVPFVETDNQGKPAGAVSEIDRDAEYDMAVKENNIQAAQKLIDEAAEARFFNSKVRNDDGTLKKVYHGTGQFGFTTFDKSKADDSRSLFFTDNKEIAEGYANKDDAKGGIYSSYLDLQNPLIVAGKGELWSDIGVNVVWRLEGTDNPAFKAMLKRINERGAAFDYTNEESDVRYKFDYDSARDALYDLFTDKEIEDIEDIVNPMDIFDHLIPELKENGKSEIFTNTRTICELAENAGYDGVIFKNIIDSASEDTMKASDVYAVFNPSAIKSADAITLDNEGKVIPLSERFNEKDSDIRFRNGEASFTPEQIARMETPILESKGTFKNLNEAEMWAKENLQGKSYTNTFTGENVYIGSKSLSEVFDKKFVKAISPDLHKAAVMSIPDFIKSGIPAEIHPDTHGRGFDVIRLYSAIIIDSNIYRVKSTVRRVPQGDRYYSYELQEMELTERRPLTGVGEEIISHNPNNSESSISELAGERRANREAEERSSVAPNGPVESISSKKSTDGTQSPTIGLDSNSRPQTRAISGEELLRGVKKTNSDEEILWNRFASDSALSAQGGSIVQSNALSSRAKVGNESEKTNESSENQQDIELDREGERSYDSVPASLNHSESGKRYAAEETASAIGVKVEYISRDEMPKGHENAKGMWKDGKIYIALENHPDANDVRRTVLHEAVGHEGLRRLVGERNMNGFCMDVYKALPASERRKIADAALQRYGGDVYEATEEYLAELAEDMDTNKSYDTIWDEIRVKTRNLLSKIGINIPLSWRDIRWILWQSYNANRQGDLINEAQRQVLADRLGFSLRADNLRAKAQEEIRLRSANGGNISAANLYNNAVARASKRLHESWVEMTNSVSTLVEAIEKQTGKAAKSFEDIRVALNQQSSKELAAIKAWERDFYNPMMSAIKEMMDAHRLKREEIDRYAFLKHGLERNDVFAKRDAKAYYQSRFEKNVKKINGDERLSELEKKLKIADAEQVRDSYFADIDAGTDKMYLKFREKDYGGLTALFSTFSPISPQGENETDEEYNARVLASRKPQFATLAETEDAARAEVDAFEKRVGKASITKLWDATNKATKSILKHQYESNMISREQYTHVKDMFKYYVPMRGFADNTASDMYSYYASDKGSITPPLLRAKGRKTQAESPWGYIGAMASTAYAADFKNETKLALFYFISNRPDNDLVRISDVWYEKTSETDPDTGKPVFKQVYPEFKDGLNAAATRQEYDRWEADMEEKRKKGEAYKGTNGIDLQNSVIHIDDAQKNSHIIRFKVRGQEKMLLINGNPRAAQAINNELNIDAAQDGITKGAQKILRWMAGFNTSYNPEFWMSNAQRDLLFSIMATSIKESPEYTKQFIANLGRAVRVIGMIRKDKQGKLGSSYMEKMYKEFVDGGAVTGFTVIKDNEEWEQVGRQFTADRNKAGQAAMQALEAIQDFGEGIEQMTRFAAFLTARENGKSITEAVADAKELTVNFNRKGSGKGISWKESEKLKNRNGEKLNTAERVFYVGASMLSGYGRRFIMFFNASVQGLNTMYQLWTKDKRRTSAWMAGYFALGAINAMLHALLDDDDDYLDMPDYERRNNLLLGGKGNYFKWALPQESRVFYAMGDILVNDMILGRNPQKKTRGVGDILEAVGDIMPINPMNGLRGVVPSAFVPLFENLQNEDYKGAKVYNEPRWLSEEEQKRTPKYTMAYSNTGRQFVLLSMGLNYISGGDSTDAGVIDLRPEKMEHLFEGLTGGLGTTLNRFWKSTGGLVIDSAIDANESGMNFGDAIRENASVRNTPFLNRLWVHNDDRYRNAHASDVFNYYKAEAEHTQNLIRKAKKEGDADLLDRLYDDDKRMNILYIYRGYSGVMKAYDRMLKITDDKAERRQLMQEQDEYRKEMIQEIAEENK